MKVEVKKLLCLRCGHRWTPLRSDVRRCSKCRSVYWDRKRERKKR